LTSALQCKKTKTIHPDKDSNPGSYVLEADAMATMPRRQGRTRKRVEL
jgi:hypothetical protein